VGVGKVEDAHLLDPEPRNLYFGNTNPQIARKENPDASGVSLKDRMKE
jgi:hypothetical protein